MHVYTYIYIYINKRWVWAQVVGGVVDLRVGPTLGDVGFRRRLRDGAGG